MNVTHIYNPDKVTVDSEGVSIYRGDRQWHFEGHLKQEFPTELDEAIATLEATLESMSAEWIDTASIAGYQDLVERIRGTRRILDKLIDARELVRRIST